MYPTRASTRPLFAKALLYMCSTPQKQPAAIVAFCAPSGSFIGAGGAADMEKALLSRDRNDIDVRRVGESWRVVESRESPLKGRVTE